MFKNNRTDHNVRMAQQVNNIFFKITSAGSGPNQNRVND